jgi:hypothetical protein
MQNIFSTGTEKKMRKEEAYTGTIELTFLTLYYGKWEIKKLEN